MNRRAEKNSWGLQLLGLTTALLVFWAPLQAAGHRLAVPHTWCDTHGHLVELSSEILGSELASLPGHSLDELPDERSETGCSTIAHERRLPTVQAVLPIVLASKGETVLAWIAPARSDRCLDCAPKQGPPTRY